MDQIASAAFLIELNQEKREEEGGGGGESQWLHLSYSIKVPTEINIAKSSVLAFFLLNWIFDWRVTSVSTSGEAACTSAMSPKHLRRSSRHLRACPILCLPDTNVIKSRKKRARLPQKELQQRTFAPQPAQLSSRLSPRSGESARPGETRYQHASRR